MAIKVVSNQFTINSADTYVIGDASQAFVGTYHVMLIDNSASMTVVVKGRSRVVGSTAATPAFVEIPYLPLNVNGTAEASYPTYSDADITEAVMILIPATGMTVALDCTAYTSGTFTAYVQPVAGAAC